MKTHHFLAIDLGASNGRVIHGVLDNEGIALKVLHRFANRPVHMGAHLYWDVLSLWRDIKEGLSYYARDIAEPLAGIAVDSWGVDFAMLDAQGRLLANPIHYRDRRTDTLPEVVEKLISAEALYEKTGIQPLQINSLYQLYSMVLAQEPLLKEVKTLLFIPDFFHYLLSGVARCERTIASTSQLLNPNELDWQREVFSMLSLPQLFPELIDAATVLGTLSPQVAAETGLSPSTPIVASAGHDTASAVVGTAKLAAHHLFLSSGTWSLIGIERSTPLVSARALKLGFTNEQGVGGKIRFLTNVMGLWLLQECQRHWQAQGDVHDIATLVSLAQEAEPLAAIVFPNAPDFLHPKDMPAAIRAFCRASGQSEPQSIGAMVRCIFDSLALSYASAATKLSELTGEHVEAIHIVGGGSQNALLNQLTADASNLQVFAGPSEATAIGNILTQAIATGVFTSLEEASAFLSHTIDCQSFEPNNTHASLWVKAKALYASFDTQA